MLVVLGDAHHQAQVALDHGAARLLVPFLGQLRQPPLLLDREQRKAADFIEVTLRDVREELVVDG